MQRGSKESSVHAILRKMLKRMKPAQNIFMSVYVCVCVFCMYFRCLCRCVCIYVNIHTHTYLCIATPLSFAYVASVTPFSDPNFRKQPLIVEPAQNSASSFPDFYVICIVNSKVNTNCYAMQKY